MKLSISYNENIHVNYIALMNIKRYFCMTFFIRYEVEIY